MKTLLICTDFSASAKHAARYGCMLASHYKFRHIVLLHAYQTMVPTTVLPLENTPYKDSYDVSLRQLKDLQKELSGSTDNDIIIRTRLEAVSLGESINDICKEEEADMVVMGITGKSKFEKLFVGSNAVTVSQTSKYPVLIVPAEAPIEPIRSILFACDLNEVTATIPLDSLDKILAFFYAPLFVVNVDNKNRHFSPQTPEEMYHLHHIFDKYRPQYAFIDREDITSGIIDYAEKNYISLIITVRRNYNFIQQLFHRSKTEKLIYQSIIPLLILHE